jgi:hypothetical protein
MWPWGHLAAGYLVYSLYTRLTTGDSPADVPALVALFGTQLPDLVDKPLAYADVLPSGRAMGHSVFFALVVGAVLWALVRRYDRPHLAVAFGFGHVAHVVGDLVAAVVDQTPVAEFGFLLWPLLPVPVYASDNVAPWVRVAEFYASPRLTPGLVLVPLVFVTFLFVERERRRRVAE